MTPEEERAFRDAQEQARAELDELAADAHAESERAIAHLTAGQRPRFRGSSDELTATREQTLALYAPADEEEERAAVMAVHRHREDAEALELLDKLGTFEQLLIERAFDAGVSATFHRMREAVGSAAATVNAEPLMRLARPPRIETRPAPPLAPSALHLRAARLALRAAETARMAHDPPAGQRMLDVRQAVDALEERLRRYHVDNDDAPDRDDVVGEVERLRILGNDVERLVQVLRDAVEGEPA